MMQTSLRSDLLSSVRESTTIPSQALAYIEKLNLLAALPGSAHLNSQEAALYIGTKPEVLRTWRSTGKGPRFKGRGHFVRYAKADLDDFMSAFDHRFGASPIEAADRLHPPNTSTF